jgi:hypothetical protein
VSAAVFMGESDNAAHAITYYIEIRKSKMETGR